MDVDIFTLYIFLFKKKNHFLYASKNLFFQVWLGQIFYYFENDNNAECTASTVMNLISNWIIYASEGVFVLIVCALLVIVFVSKNSTNGWLAFLYLLSCVKVGITVIGYLPQAMLNYRRKSTSGWNIWNNFLDIMGGILSLLQLILDSWNIHDWDGITGNPAKLGISLLTIGFDILFLLQHYVFYKNRINHLEVKPLLS